MSIKKPIIKLSHHALSQLLLMIEHDYTLQDKVFRIAIDSKGCEGFRYSAGFTMATTEDLLLQVEYQNSSFAIAIDSFAAHYMNYLEIDYQLDLESHQEGFVITNRDEKQYHGKFWKKRPELVPAIQQ